MIKDERDITDDIPLENGLRAILAKGGMVPFFNK
jgi:hypothetical protein